MNNKASRFRKKLFRINRTVLIDQDPSKLSYLINLNEERLNENRYIKTKDNMTTTAQAYWLSELAQKGIKE